MEIMKKRCAQRPRSKEPTGPKGENQLQKAKRLHRCRFLPRAIHGSNILFPSLAGASSHALRTGLVFRF